MKIISFNWTTPALVAGQKTVTRRTWDDRYARTFHAEETVMAYDRQPRFGGKPVAILKLTADPYKESTRNAQESDYEAEGFRFLEGIKAKVNGIPPRVLWRAWHVSPHQAWVVRFQVVSLVEEEAESAIVEEVGT